MYDVADDALFIGMMSGTSLDGVDAALVRFSDRRVECVHAICRSYPTPVRDALLPIAVGEPADLEVIAQLDVVLGQCYADTALTLLSEAKIDRASICAIGMHGQTIRHRPDVTTPFTVQIGDPNVVTERTRITTVADLRRRDVAAGGQGAPLVPAFHEWLYRSPQSNRAVVNIGGIANVTLLPTDAKAPVLGFDTGPGNGLLDTWIAKHIGESFDRDGAWGRSGRVNDDLLRRLLSDPYFSKSIPKSTGREVFNLAWLEHRAGDAISTLDPADVQATLGALTAQSVSVALQTFAGDIDVLYVCGGGVHNQFVMDELRKRNGNRMSIRSTADTGLDPDWVEAAAFGWLARQRLLGEPGNSPPATGASGLRVLGAIYAA
ncbi:MAG: anhydro-N-acetylmuramic acid kinase [Pseudomonadota bacterium]